MNPRFFAAQEDFRAWLKENHDKCDELIVGFYKVSSKKPSMTWPESVDQAICFGWIDGIRRKVDEESYCIRFTPRRPDSNWSKVNIEKVKKLTKAGLMRKAGREAFEKCKETRSEIYGYERKAKRLSREYRERFKAEKNAWEHFNRQPPYARKTSENWVMSAKMEKTRERRLSKLLDACKKGEKLI
ncbi:MAG: bacteriocin-protection protein [Acidobacteria bacterium]|nr:MAG: bacteriocin-protection protein [Acidobacteriota bacterium]REJ98154.1 MAG: bacteriocin-protection protein [Acidobacteriota bacterium]REK16897.1 MAG: bacteriocin-protection protein [Acidobacteriota bacterium]REK42808.1 MAG: bacteriocin-protection protein [Acidobacteriota bacterium]